MADEVVNDLCGQMGEHERIIRETPAHTLAGLAVKAKVAAEYAPRCDPDDPLVEDILLHLAEEVQRLAAMA